MKNVLLATIASSFFMFSCTEDLENTILPSESGKLQTRSLMNEVDLQVINYQGENGLYWGHVKEHIKQGIFDQNPKYSLKGRMEVWSDEIPESKKGTAKVDLVIEK